HNIPLSKLHLIAKYELPYQLLADPEKEVIKQYNLWEEKNMYGKLVFGTTRATFVIGEDGIILKIYPKANAETNAADVLSFIQSL
ncbi:MAG: redoxin domain-containing protein, partial [Oscillospiraceae bacterium]